MDGAMYDSRLWVTVAIAVFTGITAISTTARAIMTHNQNVILRKQYLLKKEELALRKLEHEEASNGSSLCP